MTNQIRYQLDQLPPSFQIVRPGTPLWGTRLIRTFPDEARVRMGATERSYLLEVYAAVVRPVVFAIWHWKNTGGLGPVS